MSVEVVSSSGVPAAQLTRMKRGTTIAVCIPARNEMTTIGLICSQIRRHLMEEVRLVDELIVIDDGSTDATADAARLAGATVIRESSILGEYARAGKGNVMWKSVAACSADIIVWCDADLTSFSPAYVERLVEPLLTSGRYDFVKAFYARPEDGAGRGGGRTTELVARPLLSRYFPEVASVRQPLGGECAIRRSLAERLPFLTGYGVETGMLIDAARQVGTRRIAQVDLGYRAHRHRPLVELAEQAAVVLSVIVDRAGLPPGPGTSALARPDGTITEIALEQRPALRSLPTYRQDARGGNPPDGLRWSDPTDAVLEEPAELLSVVDALGRRLGGAPRDLVHRDGLWHESFHCLVIRGAQEDATALFQRRHAGARAFAGLLDLTVTGHLRAGEQPGDGVREIREELGVEVSANELVELGRRVLVDDTDEGSNREWVHLFLLVDERPLDAFPIADADISSLVEVRIEDALRMLAAGDPACPGREIDRSGKVRDVSISQNDLVPQLDGHWTVLLIMAQRHLAGVGPVAI